MNREEFTRAISHALADLFDFVQLEQSPLCDTMPKEIRGEMASPGRALQQEILRSIEVLKPASDISPAALQWRTYHLLRLRYVEGMMVKEIMNHLQLGERQLRRENQRAVAAVSSLLWDRWFGPEQAPASPPAPGSPALEGPGHQQFAATPALVDLDDALQSILHTLQRMPGVNWQQITLRLPPNLPPLQTDRVLLRQALITCLHHYLTNHPQDEVEVGVEGQRTEPHVRMVLRGSSGALGWEVELLQKLQALFLQVNNHLTVEGGVVTLEIPVADSHKILIIDDDESTIHLFRRYLTGLPYTVLAVQDGREAVEQAEQILPDLILLDVLLPNVDGWEILQQLKASPLVGEVPVVVCSGWDEPEIARSLGADGFLRKNVLQKDLIDTIDRLITPAQGT